MSRASRAPVYQLVRPADGFPQAAIGRQQRRGITEEIFPGDVARMAVSEAPQGPRRASSVMQVFPLERVIVEVMPGLAGTVEMDEACTCESFRIDTVEPHMTIHDVRDIKTLEIPEAVEHGPVVLQD